MAIKDILVRAAKTAVQAFVAAVTVGAAGYSVSTLKAAALGALAAAVSVLMNAALAWSNS